MKASTQDIAVRPFHAVVARARFAVGVGVAVAGAALWLADLAYAYGGTA